MHGRTGKKFRGIRVASAPHRVCQGGSETNREAGGCSDGMEMIEQLNYKGWNSYRLTNGVVELVAPADIGPRIIRFGFVGGQNLFKEVETMLGKSGEATWMSRGGHRLWMAPEDKVKTYAPDNAAVQVDAAGDTLVLTGPVEDATGLEKRISATMDADGRVKVVNVLRNAGGAPVSLAPWALTVMAPGGTGIHAFPPRGTHPQDLN